MLYCPNCDNVLNISKNPPKIKQVLNMNTETPDEISGTGDEQNEDIELEAEVNIDNNKLEDIIVKLANDEIVPETELTEFKLEQITKNKTYQKLEKKKKSKIHTKLVQFFEKIEDAVGAYYSCKNCMYSKAIESGSLIISRNNGSTLTNYINLEQLENRKNSKILPLTRNYICPNQKCKTNTSGTDKEAVFYRMNGSMQVWYTCRVCGSFWKGN